MIALSNRVIFLNFLRTFLINFLMIRCVIFSMKMILQISIRSIFARMRILLLIVEMSTFELIETNANESRFDCFYSMIFLAVVLIASLLETSMWAKIQWMWISRSHFSILRINVCNRYWSDCFFEHWMTRMTIWQFVKMTIKRSLKWFYVMFKTKLSFMISSK
jgi:hypothetical protein